MTHIMIDLETLGVNPQAPILSIGACQFNPNTSEISRRFYRVIDWQSACKGRQIEPLTVKWWFQQSNAASKAVLEEGEQLEHVLAALSVWLPEGCRVWGNGATFDISMLEDAYRQYQMEVPWKFWNIRDVRTIVEVGKLLFDHKSLEFEGVEHNAIHDAMHQARYVSILWQRLRRLEDVVSR